jgi:WD40 repeat protein
MADQLHSTPPRRLRVFLCHSSGDKLAVRQLYQRLRACNVDPWLDEENLLPGQDWEQEIRKAVRNTDVVIVCLSRGSISKTGFVQKEIKFALDVADEQPEGTIFLIPLKLEECETPERLNHLHWVNYNKEGGFDKLIRALQLRRDSFHGRLSSVMMPTSEVSTSKVFKSESADIPLAVLSLQPARPILSLKPETLSLLRTLTGHKGIDLSVAFSPDGQTLASGSGGYYDKTIKLWNVATGQDLRTLTGHTDWVFTVAFSPDGQTLASGSRDNTIKIWGNE